MITRLPAQVGEALAPAADVAALRRAPRARGVVHVVTGSDRLPADGAVPQFVDAHLASKQMAALQPHLLGTFTANQAKPTFIAPHPEVWALLEGWGERVCR